MADPIAPATQAAITARCFRSIAAARYTATREYSASIGPERAAEIDSTLRRAQDALEAGQAREARAYLLTLCSLWEFLGGERIAMGVVGMHAQSALQALNIIAPSAELEFE